MWNLLFSHVALLVLPAASALNPTAVNMNNTKLLTCFQIDPATGDPKPNAKDASCKVVSNVPGDKESTLVFDTTVNTGSPEKPTERPTRVELKVTKDKGKPVRFEEKIVDSTNNRADTTTFDVGPGGELKNGQTSQNNTLFAWMDKDRCQAMKPLVDAVGTQPIAMCMTLAQQAVEPINKTIEQLSQNHMRLGLALPSSVTPSMVEWKPVDTKKMGDVFAIIASCAQAFAYDKMKADAASGKASGSASKQAPAGPQTKPGNAKQ